MSARNWVMPYASQRYSRAAVRPVAPVPRRGSSRRMRGCGAVAEGVAGVGSVSGYNVQNIAAAADSILGSQRPLLSPTKAVLLHGGAAARLA